MSENDTECIMCGKFTSRDNTRGYHLEGTPERLWFECSHCQLTRWSNSTPSYGMKKCKEEVVAYWKSKQ